MTTRSMRIRQFRLRRRKGKAKTVAMKYMPDGTIRGDRKAWENHPASNEVIQNAIGSRGHAAISPALDRSSGMNPFNYPDDQDVVRSAVRAGNMMVDQMVKMGEEQQVYSEGKTRVWKDKNLSRDRQSLGLPGDPKTVAQALRWSQGVPKKAYYRATTAERMWRVGPQNRSGMVSSHQKAMSEVLGKMEPEAVTSLVNDDQPGTVDKGQIATGSGVVDRPELHTTDESGVPSALLELARTNQEKQEFMAPKPVAMAHPGASNYLDPTGQTKMNEAGVLEKVVDKTKDVVTDFTDNIGKPGSVGAFGQIPAATSVPEGAVPRGGGGAGIGVILAAAALTIGGLVLLKG